MSARIARLAILLNICIANFSWAQGQLGGLTVAPSFGGPDAVENQLVSDSKDWAAWKKDLKANHGLSLGFDYTAAFLSASDVSSGDAAGGGIARAFGAAEFTANSALVVKFEYRHRFGKPAPADFSFNDLGYVGLQEAPFDNSNFRTQNLFWRQRMHGGRSTLIAGILDSTDYVDTFALSSPWLHFMNFAFSTGSATIGLPSDAAFGVAYGTTLGDGLYVIAGITDANGDSGDPFDGIDSFFTDNEYFTSVEVGWSSSQKRVMFDNFHVTAWHKDRQSAAQISDGWGMAFSLSRFVNENFMPFIRGGYANDGGSLLQKSLSLGLGYQTDAFDGLFGAGFNWGDPNENTFGQGLRDQWALELFYRIPISKRVTVTGDVQYISDPALNPAKNSIWMFNLRGRAAF